MNDQHSTVAAPVTKAISAWALVGITSWADAASFLACCYTALLITEWFWRKFWRPMLERKGYLMPKRRRGARTEPDTDYDTLK